MQPNPLARLLLKTEVGSCSGKELMVGAPACDIHPVSVDRSGKAHTSGMKIQSAVSKGGSNQGFPARPQFAQAIAIRTSGSIGQFTGAIACSASRLIPGQATPRAIRTVRWVPEVAPAVAVGGAERLRCGA